ncbi:hypothetical protein EGW08_004499 [Elysia chlorotica]|uniref:Uncharacterized protein n=1 Tax=Elysia chlorotica TaxID=188477 RepID=A0A433U1Q7_ELYCH|nr:hypothetical protein EGW08_004499 [Elysia chlorotica]
MSSFGYSGDMNDYCCVDPHSRASFMLHPANQSLLRPTFSPPVAAHSSHSSYKPPPNVQPHPVAGGISKPTGIFENMYSNDAKSQSQPYSNIGHMPSAQHVPRTALAKDKLTPRQIDSLVSDIFSSDLQYHGSSEHELQQAQRNMLPPPPSLSLSTAKKRNRKRKDPHQRKIRPAGTHIPREEIKRRRCKGEEYFTRTGKLVRKKVFQMIDCKCRRNCTTKVPEEVRRKIFEEYHAMADWNSQTQFIVASVVVTDVKRKRLRTPGEEDNGGHVSRRATSRLFYLTSKKIQVCKTVFMSTLGITGKRVDYALRIKAIPMTAIATPDRRGKKEPKNKTSVEAEVRIKAHINTFPSISGDGQSSSNTSSAAASSLTQSSSMMWPSSAGPPHSSFPSSKPPSANTVKSTLSKHKGGNKSTAAAQLHLPPDLTITKMYQLYQEQCEIDNVPAASMWVYTKILHAESKFRCVQQRQSHNSAQSSAAGCRCCDRSYAILTSGQHPETIVQQLLDLHRTRLSHSSSSSSTALSSNPSLLTPKTSSSKAKTLSGSKGKSAAYMGVGAEVKNYTN